MSNDVWPAIISAAATLGVALINKTNFDRKKAEGKNMKMSFVATKTFTWVIAPVIGALIALLVVQGLHLVAASSVPLKAPFCINGYFFPSGYMGDGEQGPRSIDLNEQWTDNCHLGPTCVKVTYHPLQKGWAGVYWQYPDGNWGEQPGRKIIGAKKLVFWARGQDGDELVTFKVGGINQKKYQDSLDKSLGPIKLGRDWQNHEIDLGGDDTSSVIGAFAWVASAPGNPQVITFYLEAICFR